MTEEKTGEEITHEGESIEIVFTEENDRKKSRVNYSYTTLEQDMKLAIEVKKYPCLYDKKSSEFKRNNDSTNEKWNSVSAALDWIQNGSEACRLFEVLKKRYSKKKMNYKRASRYLNSEEQIQKVESELEKYNFLSWLEPHIRYRTAKLVDDTDDGFYQEENVSEDGHNHHAFRVVEVSKYNDSDRKRKSPPESCINVTANQSRGRDSIPFNCPTPYVSVTQPKIPRTNEYIHEEEFSVQTRPANINNGISHSSMLYESKVINDADELFVAMVLTQLKALNEREKCLAKHEISNTLFKAQLKQLDNKHLIDKN